MIICLNHQSLSILLFIALLNEDLVEFTTLRCETTTTVLTWFDVSVVFLLRVSFTLTGETRFSQSLLLTFVSGGLTRISDSCLGRASGWGTMTKSHSLNSQRLWDFFIMIVWIAVESICRHKGELPTSLQTCTFFLNAPQCCNPPQTIILFYPVKDICFWRFYSHLTQQFCQHIFSDRGLKCNCVLL